MEASTENEVIAVSNSDETKTLWQLLESPPAYAKATANLLEWSMNYDQKAGTPFQVFLDLVGHSEENLGENLVPKPQRVLGHLEISMLADALEEYSIRPQDVLEYAEQMLNAPE